MPDILLTTPWHTAIDILFAAVIGTIIGLERARSGTAAGLRTNILIAVSACIFTILAQESFGPQNGDTNTIIGHIIAGVGFLGAGTVLHHKEKTIGLTTAASVWLVASLGIAAGAGQYFIGLFGAIIGVTVLHVLDPVSHELGREANERREQREREEQMHR